MQTRCPVVPSLVLTLQVGKQPFFFPYLCMPKKKKGAGRFLPYIFAIAPNNSLYVDALVHIQVGSNTCLNRTSSEVQFAEQKGKMRGGKTYKTNGKQSQNRDRRSSG